MSRCFPFPPPGYERKSTRVSDEAALIQESIKREQDKAEKERRKEKKREKKGKKKKEKEEKSSLNGGSEKKKHKNKVEGSSADYQKEKRCETEHLERSGLSEEHGLPTSMPKLCDSSDSTQNSGKRKKPSSPLEGSHNQSTMLRIRLPNLVKHSNPEELHTKEQPYSSSIRAESTSSKRAKIDPSSDIRQPITASARSLVPAKIDPSSDIRQPSTASARSLVPARCSSAHVVAAPADIGPNPSIMQSSSISRRFRDAAECSSGPGVAAVVSSHPSIEQSCSISGRTEAPVQESTAAAVSPGELSTGEISSLSDKQLRRVLKKWIPPVIDMGTDSGDVDWLFDVPCGRELITPKVSHVASCHEGGSLWPKARYLPDAEIYALPYTVPF